MAPIPSRPTPSPLRNSIGIMVGGVLRCLGSTQRLRTRYGHGYQVRLEAPRALSSTHTNPSPPPCLCID